MIIPTFNRRTFITGAVESVLAQGLNAVEIIVVDDGSTDGTEAALEPYGGVVRYIYQNNRGVSAARNRGVQESRGEWLAFLDSDDQWVPGKRMTQLCRACSNEVLSFGGVEWFVDRAEDQCLLEKCGSVKWPRSDEAGYILDPILDVAEGRYLHLGTLLCRKAAFLDVGFFDEHLCLGEDEDWFSRASTRLKFHYTTESLLRIRYHGNQTRPEREECLRSLITVFSEMKGRTNGLHPRAHASANRRLAAQWSHLANHLALRGQGRAAWRAAWQAFVLRPINVKRLVKAAVFYCRIWQRPQ